MPRILFTNDKKNEFSFSSEEEFIEWMFNHIELFKNSDFTFESKNGVNTDRVFKVYRFLKYYISLKEDLNIKIDNYNKELLKSNYNEDLKKAFSEFARMNNNGKFLRAMLVGLGYHSTTKQDDKYLGLALALEVFQTSILIHDDIIDNADIRRGIPTIPISYRNSFDGKGDNFINKRNDFSDAMALCIGDLGFYLAEEIITNSYKNNSNLADILSYYHQTAIKTCLGEMLDICLPFKEEFYDHDKNIESKIMDIYKLKTAWYSVVGPYCLGLTLGGAPMKCIKKMEDILLNIGIAYQIKDDLLDIFGDFTKMGKTNNGDIAEFKQTILYSYVMNSDYKDELLKYYGKSDLSDKEINKVKEIFEVSGARKYAENKMKFLFKETFNEIDILDFIDKDFKEILQGFILYLEYRSK